MKRWVSLIVCILCLLGFCVTASADKQKISLNAKYTLLTPASEAFPDDGKKLTDGHCATAEIAKEKYFSSPAFVGFNKNNLNENQDFLLLIDLGRNYYNITDFTVGYLSQPQANIIAPKSVSFAVSATRNGNYTTVGTLQTACIENNPALHAKNLEASPVNGRYVLVTVTPGEYQGKVDTATLAPWTFIDEISVYSAGQKSATADQPTADQNIPQAGDEFNILGILLLCFAAVAMAIALFVNIAKKRY